VPADYPPIADYALIGDCHAAALVSRSGSIDWCCVPRVDSASCFGRLLDAGKGGYCEIAPVPEGARTVYRAYIEDTLVLETTLRTAGGQARLIDFFTLRDDAERPVRWRELVRIVEGERGAFDVSVRVAPRFDYGAIDPWMRHQGSGCWSAIGGDEALAIWSDAGLEAPDRHSLETRATVRPGDRLRLSLTSVDPAELESAEPPHPAGPDEVDRRLEQTIERWREWAERLDVSGPDASGARRSAIVLKALTYEPTGAIAAAATTSLPEGRGCAGERNWDYRYSWIRDSALAVRSLARLGYESEAEAFRRFAERSAAGNAKDLQVVYGLGGERRLTEQALDHLEGYRGASPVRIGNAAVTELQLDAYGQLLDQSWEWYERGHEPDDDYWRFLLDLVDAAVERWQEPDRGIWEWPGEPRHFVHSKAFCWVAVDRGLRLAEHCLRKAPERRWKKARDEIRGAIEERGYDADRGIFVQAFGARDLDAALLRLPTLEFIDHEDERMVRTVGAIRSELDFGGLLRRYTSDDGLEGEEGAFLPCTFWLASVLAGQGRTGEAREAFDRAIAAGNGVGLFSEEYDPESKEMLGNFPQALTHLSHLEAALALAEAEGGPASMTKVAEPGGDLAREGRG
jgi:GH15 family glucan-1,4-alpha-glucosidase